MTKRAEKWPVIGWWWHHPRNIIRGGLDIVTDKTTKKNKTFNKRKNGALLTLRRSQKDYEIFSNNVLRKNITRKHLRSETIEIAWFNVGSVLGLSAILFHILCIAWLRDLQSETCLPCTKEKRSYNWPYRWIYTIWICSKGFDEHRGFIFFPQRTQPLLLAR